MEVIAEKKGLVVTPADLNYKCNFSAACSVKG